MAAEPSSENNATIGDCRRAAPTTPRHVIDCRIGSCNARVHVAKQGTALTGFNVGLPASSPLSSVYVPLHRVCVSGSDSTLAVIHPGSDVARVTNRIDQRIFMVAIGLVADDTTVSSLVRRAFLVGMRLLTQPVDVLDLGTHGSCEAERKTILAALSFGRGGFWQFTRHRYNIRDTGNSVADLEAANAELFADVVRLHELKHVR